MKLERATAIRPEELGIYTASEVAYLLRATSVPRVRDLFLPRTVGGSRKSVPVFTAQYRASDAGHSELLLGFLNLIEVRAALRFREQGVSLPHLRRAYKRLQAETNQPHPFAFETTYASQGEILWRTFSEVGETDMKVVANLQKVLPQFFWDDAQHAVTFDEQTRLASEMSFPEWRRIKPLMNSVIVRPALNFGRPTLEESSVPTRVLADAYHANGEDAEAVAGWYAVAKAEVESAVNFEHWLRRPLSARVAA